MYVNYLERNGRPVVVQQYLPEAEGEFTVGVLSLPDGSLLGSIALRRLFHNKLSVLVRSDAGLISTGYSQGLIDDFPEVRRACERIAVALGSRGPLNVQGRVHEGVFYPLNQPAVFGLGVSSDDGRLQRSRMYIRHVQGERFTAPVPRAGYYLRSLTETYAPAPTEP